MRSTIKKLGSGPTPHTKFPDYAYKITIPLKNGASASLPASLGIVLAALKTHIDKHKGYATKIIPEQLQAYTEAYGARLVSGPHPSQADKVIEATEHYDNPKCVCGNFGRVALTELGERFLDAYTEFDELGKPKRR